MDTIPSAISGLPGASYLIKLVLKWILLIFTFHKSINGQNLGPAYSNTGKHCSSNGQCVTSIGEICWWFYDGCTHGQCMCDPRSHFMDSSGKCREVRYGRESCYAGDKCPVRMSCIKGKCLCREGEMTDDLRYCLKSHEKILGESCNPDTDVCFQATVSGYHTKMVYCPKDRQCRCRPGFKQEGAKCRKLNISEGPCGRDHHCQGGALCIDSSCMCPTGYMPVAGNSKCARIGGKYDLGIGAHCDEINERRYCAQGLVCHKCPNQNEYTCVKYKASQTYNSALVGAGVNRKVTIICIVMAVVGAILFIAISLFYKYYKNKAYNRELKYYEG